MANKKNSVAMSPSFDRDYQGEDDHRTLTRAAEIVGDKDRMKGARKHHREAGKKMSLVSKTMLGGSRR